MGVDRYRVCELYAAGPDGNGSGSGYRLGSRLVLTARHVIDPALAAADGRLLLRPLGVPEWLPARVEWADADADAALAVIEAEDWEAPAGESVLRWGKLAGSDPVPCAAVGFPWASARPDRVRDTAHLYGQLAPLGQLKQDRLDLDVASASPSAREDDSPWAGMSGAGVIADSHLVGVITVDPARYRDRLVAVPVSRLLADEDFRERLAAHAVPAEAASVGGGWYLRLPGEQAVSLEPPYRPVSRRFLPAPSTLLRPEHGLVPFLGRQSVIDHVTGWCHDPAGSPLMLVTGGGGSGKTRLGREACVRMLVAGWDAGLADDQRRDGAATDRLERPTLLVVDDADLSTGLICALIGYLRRDDASPPARLLLLSRATGAWWDQLVRQQELYGNYTVLDLDRHPVPSADRAEHFRRASIAFATYSGSHAPPAEPPPAPELADPAYAEPLLIHIAALLRTLDTPATPPPGSGAEADQSARLRLLRALCERERTRWYQLGGQLPWNHDLPLVDHVVALATLTAAASLSAAMSLLAALPNQAEVTRLGAEALAVWAHRLYAGPGYWNPVRPDLLAEQQLADTPQLSVLTAAAARLAASQPWEADVLAQLLAELTRGAPNQPAIRSALDELLGEALPSIVLRAVYGDHAGLADLASLALQQAPQPALAAKLAGLMPEHSVRLAALAATLASQHVTHCRTNTKEGPDAAERLASSLHDLSLRLSDLGRREEALAASTEAVSIIRELAAARPETSRPILAGALNTLSILLGDLGRREEALAASMEAAGLFRKLATARPEAFRPTLAMSLNTLSNQLDGLGRREAALAAIQEATGIYRKLAAVRPEVFRPMLATVLTTLSLRLKGLGQREEALAALEEAVGIRREQAAARPDAYQPDLAGALTNLSEALAGLGRADDALAANEEGTRILRELVRGRPEAFMPDLASSLNNLALRLGDVGRAEEALAANEETTGIYRELAAARPEAFGPDLAGSLNNLALRLADLGRREEALAAVQEAVTIRRELAAGRPEAFGPDLALSLNNLALRLVDVGRREEALAASEEATGLYRELTAARPDAFRPDQALSLTSLSRTLADLGRAEEALVASEEATGLYRELAAARPEAFRSDLAASLTNLTADLANLGRREAALVMIEEATGIYRQLAAAQPGAFRPRLASSLTSLAGTLGDLGRPEEAVAAGEEAVTIFRELAAARPEAFRPDLAMALNNLANRLGDLGRREEALAASGEATGLYRELAAARPEAFRPDLARSLNALSTALARVGRAEDALAASDEAASVYWKLAQVRPDAFRPGLAMSLNNLANRLGGVGRHEDALVVIGDATGLYRELTAARPEAFRPDLAMSLNNLAVGLGSLGRPEEGLAASVEATGVYRELAAARPDAFRPDLARSLNNLSLLLGGLGRAEQDPETGQQRRTLYYVAVTPQFIIMGPRKAMVRDAVARISGKTSGGTSSANSVVTDPEFVRLRSLLPEKLSGIGGSDLTGIPWDKIIARFIEQMESAKQSNQNNPPSAELLRLIKPGLVNRHLKASANGWWKDSGGIYFDYYLQ